ncbi:MAG: hypothetical protein AB7O67_18415 [Vicinamibacterales bacterium]
MSARPVISVILTGGASAAGRRQCRDWFAHGVPAIEILEPPRHGTVAAQRNAMLQQARAAVVLFWDAAWRPHATLIPYLRERHASQTAAGDAVLVHAAPGVGVRNSTLARWYLRQGPWPARPPLGGVYSWTCFRAPGLSVRRELFAHGHFDEAFETGDDAELAARLQARVPVRVWFEPFPLASIEAVPPTALALRDAFLDGYFRRLRWMRGPGVRDLRDLERVHVDPDQFARTDKAVADAWTTAVGLEASFEGVELSFVDKAGADRLQILFEAYDLLFSAAIANGHRQALAGGPPALPDAWTAWLIAPPGPAARRRGERTTPARSRGSRARS